MTTKKPANDNRTVLVEISEQTLMGIKKRAEKESKTIHQWIQNAVTEAYLKK